MIDIKLESGELPDCRNSIDKSCRDWMKGIDIIDENIINKSTIS